MRQENLLIEIGTEELPPKSLKKLAQAFAANVEQQLQDAELAFEQITWFASPRRLALQVTNLAGKQQDKVLEKRGPAVSAAFDAEGTPTPAALGWARSNGIDVSEAERLTTDKGEWLLYHAAVEGQSVDTLLPEMVNHALKKLPIPKPMRWGDKATQFIRPVHTVTMLYGGSLIAGEVLGLPSDRVIQGHRFHGESTFTLDHADNYLASLKAHYVLADFQSRRAAILEGLEAAAKQDNAHVDLDDDLLDEVTALVEWPVVLRASFEAEFLEVPKEALIYTMKDDQKYFPLLAQDGKLLPHFLFVSNIESQDPAQVIRGNEKVIRPRLADARFFYETDKKASLESRLASLDSVLFQKQLGTLREKSERIAKLAEHIAKQLSANEAFAFRAGQLCKTDLMTNMVMEFPDVQGVMGMYYALNDGEDIEVAKALDEQYKPRFAGDSLPEAPVSCALALADKLDTLVGIFGIGQVPKGDKDPFALRRAAIGVLRIIVENDLTLDLDELVSSAIALFDEKLTAENTQTQVVDFVLARFRTWYQEQGVEIDVIQAVMAKRPTKPADFAARINGVTAFKKLDAAEALAAANKRVANILAKNAVSTATGFSRDLLSDAAELALADAIAQAEKDVNPLLAQGDYTAALENLAQLRDRIDAFFDNVMVMAEDEAVRNNRLSLLLSLRTLFLHTADISILN